MNLDRIFALIAFVVLSAYLLVLVGFVPLVDMGVVIVVCIALAGYDFWSQLRGRNGGS